MATEYSHEEYEPMGVVVWSMKMPRSCMECPLHFDGMCCVAPADVKCADVTPTDERPKPDWCPLELVEDVYMRHYLQGRKDERAIMEGRLMQAFSPD